MTAFTDDTEDLLKVLDIGSPTDATAASTLETAITSRLITPAVSAATLPGVVSAIAEGATGDGVTDDTDALQAAIDGLAEGERLLLPAGTYIISKPLVVSGVGIGLVGAGRELTTIEYESQAYGPAIVYGDHPEAFPTVTQDGLTCLDCSSQTDWILNLSENTYLVGMNGDSAFTVELQMYINALTAGVLIECHGGIDTDGADVAYSLSWNGGSLICSVTMSGGTVSVTTANVSTGWNEIQFNVSANTLRLFVNGTLEDSDTVSGTLVVNTRMSCQLGGTSTTWPNPGSPTSVSMDAYYSCVRITSGRARETGNYTATPQTKLVFDGNDNYTVVDFTQTHENMLMARIPGVDTYAYHPRHNAAPDQIRGIVFQDFALHGGILGMGAINSRIRRVETTSRLYGVNWSNNCYSSTIEDYDHYGSGSVAWFGIGVLQASGLATIRDIDLTCNSDGIVQTASSVTIENAFVIGCAGRYGAIFLGGSVGSYVSATQLDITQEDQLAGFTGGIYLGPVPNATFRGCTINNYAFDQPCFVLDECGPIEWVGGSVTSGSGGVSAPIVRVHNTVATTRLTFREGALALQSGHPLALDDNDAAAEDGVVYYDTGTSGSTKMPPFTVSEANEDAHITLKRPETVDSTQNPYFRIGDIQSGGVNLPMLMIAAGADNLDEKNAFIVEWSGTCASVSQGDRISHWEAFLQEGDVVPVMRLSSSPNMTFEMGPGGAEVAIGNLSRTAGVTTATTETAHDMAVGDSFLMSHSEAEFPAFTSTPKTVLAVNSSTEFVYADTDGANGEVSTIAHYVSGMTDVHWKRTGPNAAAIALGGTNRITFEAGEIGVAANTDLYVDKNGGTNPLLWANYSSSRVGIGATTPGSKLHVQGTVAAEKVAIIQAPGSNSNHVMDWQNSAGASLAFVRYDGLIYSGPGFNTAATYLTTADATGIATVYNGDLKRGQFAVQVTYTAFTAAALTEDVLIATLPAKTKVTEIICDTPYNYWGTGAGSYQIRIGHTSGGQEYIVDHDVRSGAVTAGLADADLGTSINRANAVQGGHIPSWSATNGVYLRLTSDVNLTNITAGQSVIYISVERY